MVAEPVQLRNSAAKHGARYTAADREAAFAVYRLGARRSLRRTAEATGVSAGTIANWAREDGWPARARAEEAAEAGSVREALRLIVAGELLPSIERAVEVRDNAGGNVPPRDQLAAAAWLAGLAGVSAQKPVGLPEPAPEPYDPAAPRLDPDEVRRRQRELAGIYGGGG